jgi:hypothetical protein
MNVNDFKKMREDALKLLDIGRKADALDRVWQSLNNRDEDPKLWELRGFGSP